MNEKITEDQNNNDQHDIENLLNLNTPSSEDLSDLFAYVHEKHVPHNSPDMGLSYAARSSPTASTVLMTKHKPLHLRFHTPDMHERLNAIIDSTKDLNGTIFKTLREEVKSTLADISRITKIQERYLKSIESDNYRDLPALVYFKGFLSLYLGYLGLNRPDVILKLSKRYTNQKSQNG